MVAAPFVADPARNANVKVAVEVVLKLVAGASEAVNHRAWQAREPAVQHFDEIRVRISLVKKYRQLIFGANFKLFLKCSNLNRLGREIPEEIQSAFATSHYFRLLNKGPESRFGAGFEQVRGVMRVNAGRATHGFRPLTDDFQGPHGAGQRCPGDDHSRDARGLSARDHGGTVVVEAVVPKVQADVDEAERGTGGALGRYG
jgi:hypothetical protein